MPIRPLLKNLFSFILAAQSRAQPKNCGDGNNHFRLRYNNDNNIFYLFTKQQVVIFYDSSLKIQNNRNRYYDYYTGRWLQRDPLGYVDSMNLYEYVRSQPTKSLDPFGLMGYTLSYDWECRRNANGKLYVHIIKGVEIKSSSTFVGKATPVDIPSIPGAAFGIKFEVEIYSLVYDSWDCQPGECGEVKIAFVGLQDISRMGFFENASGKPIKIYDKTIYRIFTDWAVKRCCEAGRRCCK